MNFSKQIKWYWFYIVGVFVIVSTVSCGGPPQPAVELDQISSSPTSTPSVEYGASLDEWEEAAGDLEQGGSSGNDMVMEDEIESDSYPAPDISEPSDNYPASENTTTPTQPVPTTSLVTLDNITYQEVMWDALIPENFTADAIMAKYTDQLEQIEDGSPEGLELYAEMQKEFNNAPVNQEVDGTLIKLPGFIAPLEYTDDLITEFLLVPYFGACIHVPPPPVNQTVLVKTGETHGIKIEDSYGPIWILGTLTTDKTTTELAEAGYYMENAIIEPYSELP